MEDDDLPSLDALPDGLDRGEVRVLLLEAVEEVTELIILVVLREVQEVLDVSQNQSLTYKQCLGCIESVKWKISHLW